MSLPDTTNSSMPPCAGAEAPTIGVAVITHCAKPHLPHCLPPLLQSTLHPRVVVVNSSSHDGTVELAQELGAETLVIPRSEFNHGLTREKARQYLGTDIVVMITPDAYATDASMLEKLVRPIIEKKAAAAYGRQLPHDDAGFFAAFAREFNYPPESHIRTLDDMEKYGVYTFFCSDSCAAYDNAKLEKIGGIPEVLIGEDTVVAAKLLRQGEAIAYVADAMVHHSHDYTLWQEFQRHFDTGLARQRFQELLACSSGDEKRGITYMRRLFLRLLKKAPHKLPYACLQTGVKYLGYKLGRWATKWPASWKRVLSSQDYYWEDHER